MANILVSFRGNKLEIPLSENNLLTVGDVKKKVSDISRTIDATELHSHLEPNEVKLILKGKVLANDDENLQSLLSTIVKKSKAISTIRIMAMGVSNTETQKMEEDFQDGVQKSSRLIRDDISDSGKQRMKERQIIGRKIMKKAIRPPQSSIQESYGFGRIETLPNLPDESKARQILTELANDPGVKACMAKHRWNVGSLAELYPEGKVGESAVCVMGLNRNKGQQILLRLRTDDLKGFRKMLSIREVLYHELAHNVHSEHDSNFFQLMRQIKRECLELDWTRGNGISEDDQITSNVTGGTYVLGGNTSEDGMSVRDLAGRAAMLRLTAEEELVREGCGCGHEESLSRRKKARNEHSRDK